MNTIDYAIVHIDGVFRTTEKDVQVDNLYSDPSELEVVAWFAQKNGRV